MLYRVQIDSREGVMATIIIQSLELNLTTQSVPITLKFVGATPACNNVYSIGLYVIHLVSYMLQAKAHSQDFSRGVDRLTKAKWSYDQVSKF